jgi:hypothetical protein
MTFSDEMIAVADELLTEYGFNVTVRGPLAAYNPVTLTTNGTTASSLTGKAIYFDPSNSKMTGYERSLAEDGSKGGKWMILLCLGVVKTGHVVEVGSRKFVISYLTEIGPTDQVIYYKIKTDEIA